MEQWKVKLLMEIQQTFKAINEAYLKYYVN